MSYLTNPYRYAVTGFDKSNILVYYKFDETSGTVLTNYATTGNGFSDGLGGNNDGTNASGVTVNVSGIIDKAFDYDFSADGYTQIDAQVWEGSGDYSVNLWLYHTLESGNEAVLVGGTNQDLVAYQGSTGLIGAGNTPILKCTTDVPLNTWFMLTYTRSGTDATVYFNGSSENTGTNSTTINGGAWTIGGALTDIGENWHGRVDEFCFADRVFSADEITELYNSGSALSLV